MKILFPGCVLFFYGLYVLGTGELELFKRHIAGIKALLIGIFLMLLGSPLIALGVLSLY
jgi:hypothetical protein